MNIYTSWLVKGIKIDFYGAERKAGDQEHPVMAQYGVNYENKEQWRDYDGTPKDVDYGGCTCEADLPNVG